MNLASAAQANQASAAQAELALVQAQASAAQASAAQLASAPYMDDASSPQASMAVGMDSTGPVYMPPSGPIPTPLDTTAMITQIYHILVNERKERRQMFGFDNSFSGARDLSGNRMDFSGARDGNMDFGSAKGNPIIKVLDGINKKLDTIIDLTTPVPDITSSTNNTVTEMLEKVNKLAGVYGEGSANSTEATEENSAAPAEGGKRRTKRKSRA